MSIKQFYVIMDIVNGVNKPLVFADKNTALRNAHLRYSMFSSSERNKRTEFYVCVSSTADVTSVDFGSGEIIRRYK